MTSVRRFDLLTPATKTRRDDVTGFLHTVVRATRTGVQAYRNRDGKVTYELRHPEDVFDPTSLETLKRIVVTRGHPKRADGAPVDVTTDNVRQLQVGHGGDTVRQVTVNDEGHPEVDVTLTDAGVIASVTAAANGKRRDQVSMGYFTEVVEEAGNYKGQPYTHRHRNIRYNHLAVDIDAGRWGPSVAMLLDEADAVVVDDDHPSNRQWTLVNRTRNQGQTAVKLTIDGIEVEFADAGVASIVKAAIEKRDSETTNARTAAQAKADELERVQAKLDQAQKTIEETAKADAAEPDLKASTIEVIRVLDGASRLVELTSARRDELLGLDGEGDLPARIRRNIVTQALPTEAKNLASKSDAYIEARFDALLAEAERAGENHRRVAATVVTAGRTDTQADDRRDPDLTPLLGAYDPLEIMGRLDESEANYIVRR